jgi:hypothetical protein
MSEYEKVDLKVWEVVERMSEGKKLYVKAIDSYVLITPNYSIALINKDINNIYTHKGSQWWGGCEGSVIMVMSSGVWELQILSSVEQSVMHGIIFLCRDKCHYINARPLTTAERDEIKVQD